MMGNYHVRFDRGLRGKVSKDNSPLCLPNSGAGHYTQLGLDKGLVASDIHNISISRLPRPARASKSPSTTPTQPASSFALDRNLLQLLEEETKEAQSVLESIFSEEEFAEDFETDTATTVPMNNGSSPGLDTQFQQLYNKLISQAEWSHEELQGLCDGLHLMTEGAVETINDWAFEHVNAPLIEDGSTVYVDIELAEEIAALQTQEQLP